MLLSSQEDWHPQEEPALFARLLGKSEGERAQWEYPFAVAGVNLTFMLQVHACPSLTPSLKRSLAWMAVAVAPASVA